MPRSRILAPLVAVVLGAMAVVAHADLDAAQTRLLDEATRALEIGETNRKVVEGGLSAGAVSASQARLARTRLDTVKTALAEAEARLARLPTGEATVEPVRTRAAALAAAVAAIEARLGGGAPAAPSGGGSKLDYRQRETLKNAEWNTREVVGKAAAIVEIATDAGKAADPLRFDRRRLANAVATLEDARRKAKNAQGHLDALPPEGEGVAAVAADLRGALASLDASEKVVLPLHESLLAALDPTKRPEHVADQRRLADLAGQFRDEQLFRSNPRAAAVRWTELAAARAERERIVGAYAVWIDQGTEEGRRLGGAAAHLKDALDAFETAGKVAKSFLPGETDQAIEQAGALVDRAVAEQKPAFFGGGIPQALGQVEEALALLVVLDPEAAKARTAAFDALKASVKAKQASLRDAIVAANELAPDRYRADDRAALEATAKEAWAKVEPGAVVLRIVIPSEAWARETVLRRRTSDWVVDDASRLQVQLVVKGDGKVVVLRPVNLVRDHTKGDTIQAYPMDAKGDELPPSRYYLAEKVR